MPVRFAGIWLQELIVGTHFLVPNTELLAVSACPCCLLRIYLPTLHVTSSAWLLPSHQHNTVMYSWHCQEISSRPLTLCCTSNFKTVFQLFFPRFSLLFAMDVPFTPTPYILGMSSPTRLDVEITGVQYFPLAFVQDTQRFLQMGNLCIFTEWCISFLFSDCLISAHLYIWFYKMLFLPLLPIHLISCKMLFQLFLSTTTYFYNILLHVSKLLRHVAAMRFKMSYSFSCVW